MYVVHLADQGLKGDGGLAVSSIGIRNPRLAMVLEGVTRAKSVGPRRQAAPAVVIPNVTSKDSGQTD